MVRLKQQMSWAVTGKTVLIVFMAVLFSVLFFYMPKVLLEAGNQNKDADIFCKTLDRQLAAGVQAVQSSSGCKVSFKSCRAVKPKIGAFRLGAFNVLEVDDLEITLPCIPAANAGANAPGARSASEPFQNSLNAEKLSALAGLDQRVSMLKVNGLRLFMTDRTLQRVSVVTSRSAKSSGTSSIVLEECELLTEQMDRIRVPKAKICFGETIIIEAAGRRVNLNALAENLSN